MKHNTKKHLHTGIQYLSSYPHLSTSPIHLTYPPHLFTSPIHLTNPPHLSTLPIHLTYPPHLYLTYPPHISTSPTYPPHLSHDPPTLHLQIPHTYPTIHHLHIPTYSLQFTRTCYPTHRATPHTHTHTHTFSLVPRLTYYCIMYNVSLGRKSVAHDIVCPNQIGYSAGCMPMAGEHNG